MRLINIEEHYMSTEIAVKIKTILSEKEGNTVLAVGDAALGVTDLGETRIAYMNDRKINTQVISYASDLPATMEKEYAVLLCKEVNDEMYEELRKNPGRFYAFAHLPLSSPEDAAIELERCVKELGFVGAMLSGHYKDMPYDDPFYLLILHIQADEFMIFWIGHFTAQEATKFMMLLNLSLE
uniref:amidohydrolase family protein n=1 Tax=Enterocloster clostridioformis TaxID=1531 RepID=UPI002F410F35